MATPLHFPRTRGIWMNSQGLGMAPTGTSIRVGSRRAKRRRSAARSSSGSRARRPAAPKLSAYLHEIRIGEVAGNQPIAELLLLDAPHIAESAVGEHDRHQRDAVAHGGGELVAGVEKSAVAVDREHRNVRPRVLRAERGGIAPAEIVLVAGRKNVRGL